MPAETTAKILQGLNEADKKLFAACFAHSGMGTTAVDWLAVAQELDVDIAEPKKAIAAMKERVRKAKLEMPGGIAGGAAPAPAGGVDKTGVSKTSPTKPRKGAGSKASPVKKGAKKPLKREEDDEEAEAEE